MTKVALPKKASEKPSGGTTDGPGTPGHPLGEGSRPLRDVTNPEWDVACDQWLDAVCELFREAGEGGEQERLGSLALRLATVNAPLCYAIDKHGGWSARAVEFGIYLQGYARSGNTNNLERARQLVAEVSALVVSLKQKLSILMDEEYRRSDQATGKEARSEVVPLTEQQAAVLSLLKGLPPGGGLTGSELVKRLDLGGQTVSQSGLTTRIMPTLRKHHGVRNRRGVGYYIP